MTNRQVKIRFDEKRGYYIARITTGKDKSGQPIRRPFYGKTEEEVREKLKEYEQETQSLQPGSVDAVFRVYFKKWLALKKREVKSNSYRRYESLWNTYISKAPFVDRKLEEITYSDLKSFYASIQSAGASLKTVEYIHTLIKGMLLSAIEDRLLSFNPAAKIKFKSTKSKKAQALSKEDQQRLIRYLQFNTDEMGELIIFDLGTGLRLGEVLALRWTDIDMEKGIIHVCRNLQRVTKGDKYVDEESTPKTHNSIRSVPLPSPIL